METYESPRTPGNRLSLETSPYLLQHANNPVDWFPWGSEAFDKARIEDKPLFLSIGYAACHWCHVMAHESFENPETARILKEGFVAVKVDREERPDLDAIYMSAVIRMTGRGGWPMSVFLLPDARPFYGGTYFPPAPRYGMPSFVDLLEAVSDAWRRRRREIEQNADVLAEELWTPEVSSEKDPETLAPDRIDVTLKRADEALINQHEDVYGGWGRAPKFPQATAIAYALARPLEKGGLRPRIHQTLAAMADGGVYDQLGGGFHRYSTDDAWTVPHFEKMLYDNAMLARVYRDAARVFDEPRFRRIADETLEYLLREMRHSAGGFFSSQDADSEGEEGRFFVWTQAEVRAVLGEKSDAFERAFEITQNVLRRIGSRTMDADDEKKCRTLLFEAREKREKPGRDEKILASWNGLTLSALAEAARESDAKNAERYKAAAEQLADFLVGRLCTTAGRRLRRSWKDGKTSGNGFLEDYAAVAEGLLALYETTFDTHWFAAARNLADEAIGHFSAPHGFYDTSDDHEVLITRPRETHDTPLPSGNAWIATVLLKLYSFTGDPVYRSRAEAVLTKVSPEAGDSPIFFGQALLGLETARRDTLEIAIAGDLADIRTRELLVVVRRQTRPNLVVAVGTAETAAVVPLLRDRPQIEGRPTAYVCLRFVCEKPVTTANELEALLDPLKTIASRNSFTERTPGGRRLRISIDRWASSFLGSNRGGCRGPKRGS